MQQRRRPPDGHLGVATAPSGDVPCPNHRQFPRLVARTDNGRSEDGVQVRPSGLPAATSRAGRILRATTVTGLSVALSGLSHTLACGIAPPLAIVAFSALVLGWFAWRGSAAELTAGWLVAAVLGSQLSLHVMYAIAEAAPNPDEVGAMDSAAMSALSPDAMAGHLGASGLDLLPGGMFMLFGHLAVAALLIGWLRAGERLLWRAAAKVATVVAEMVDRITEPWPGTAATRHFTSRLSPRREVSHRLRQLMLEGFLVRRGPPLPQMRLALSAS